MDDIAENIRTAMAARDLNQRSLALKAGLNETAVRDILTGRSRSPKVDTIRAIARALRVPVDDIIGGTRRVHRSELDPEILRQCAMRVLRIAAEDGGHDETDIAEVICQAFDEAMLSDSPTPAIPSDAHIRSLLHMAVRLRERFAHQAAS